MSKKLMVAPCSFEAVKYSCEHFHYSKKVPHGKLIKHGVWEDNQFIGVLVYNNGANLEIGSPYGLEQTQICELSRIALYTHSNPVTKILSKSLKLLHEQNPGLVLVISYADPEQNHLGIIYQAGSWIYDGQKRNTYKYIINGKLVHGRTVHARYGTAKIKYLRENVDKNAEMVYIPGKFKYLFPLTKSARKRYAKIHKPYPKTVKNERRKK